MYAIIRYNQKRIIQNFENFIFHNLQIGVNWCAEWQVIGTYSRKHSRCKKLDTINLQEKYGKRRAENFGRYGNYLQNWKCMRNA